MSGFSYGSKTEVTIPFVVVHVAEILDSRLDHDSLRLLLLLRHRCGENESVWASHQTLADDLGIGYSTVRKAAAKLVDLGFLRAEQTAKHVSTDKYLMPVHDVYDPEVLYRPSQFLRSDRTDVDLKRMHSLPLTEDEKLIPPPRLRNVDEFKVIKRSLAEYDDPPAPDRAPPCSNQSTPLLQIEHPPAPDRAPNKNHRITTREQEQEKATEPLRGGSSLLETIEEVPLYSFSKNKKTIKSDISPSYSEIKPVVPEDDSQRMELARASFEKSKEEFAARMRKRQQARLDGTSSYEAAQKKLAKEEAKAQREKNRPPSARTAEGWWRDLHRAYHPGITHTKWSTKEMKWAADMISDYGPQKVQRAFDYLFDNWERYRRDYSWKKLGLVPGMDFLYAERRNIMAEVETLLKHNTSSDDDGNSGSFF